MTEQQRQRLRNIKTFPQLIAFLRDDLDWPIDQGHDEDDLTFDWSDDLGLKDSERVGIKEIKQLRPLETGQPWGIFFVSFEKKQLPIVILRRILNSLVMKKRASANKAQQAAWKQHDLLFISAYGEDTDRQLTFAHFSEPAAEEDATKATLRVLGWDDDDTNLKLDYVADQLKASLTWPTDPNDVPAWRTRWSAAFKLRHRQVIDTAEELALRLAELAKRIRNRMLLVLPRESESGELRKLLKGFKTALIHDLDEKQFADMYAQTITYGLFSAAVSRTVPGAGTAVVQGNVVDMIPVTNPFLKEMLQSFLKAGGRKGKLDFDELGIQEVVDLLNDKKTNLEAVLRDFGNKTRGEDPVIHFYEKFLAAYDKKLKVKRGVFYTPQPVVSYIVRSVHELLQTEFGLEDGLADITTWGEMLTKHADLKLPPLTDEPGEKRAISPDEPFVQILDPATGTATFLVEVIDVIHRTMAAKWKKQGMNEAARGTAWNDYVPKHLLPRLHAFELMMAPYAIAHMKIGLKLAETGYRFGSEERARVYLTNALAPKVKQLPLIGFDALAHEAAAVNEIKWYKRFTVVIGNPPYSLVSANMEPAHRTLVERYKFIAGEPLRERGALQLEKILNDDYVKFIAKSQDFLTSAGTGLVGLITNHAYLDNPTMRGLRHSFIASFKQGYFYDLGGSAKKVGENVDENVFDIQQGVAICIAVKSGRDSELANRYSRLIDFRETKYKVLGQSSVKDTEWSELSPSPPYYLFVPTDYGLRSEYEQFVPLSEIFPLHSIGCFTSKDHFLISRDPQQLVANAIAFRDSKLPDKELCKSFEINPKDAWDVSRSREQIQRLNDGDIAKRVLRFTHRPFDLKHIFFHRSLVWSLAYPVNRNLMKGGNLALVTSRQLATPPWSHVFCSSAIVEMFLMSNKTKEGNHVFPLYVLPDEDDEQRSLDDEESRPNLFSAFLKQLASALKLQQAKPYNLPVGLTPEDIVHYAYAGFHSPTYRSRYAEFLKIDFPRLPLTGSLELFRALAQLGSQLVALHLLESPRLDQPLTEFIGSNKEVAKVGYAGGTVWIDAIGTKDKFRPGTSGFRGVPETVWNFHIGGYQVCEKWLKDRKGRTLSSDDIRHYHRIVVALSETIRLMTEIDRVIDEHGGWPGAFTSTSAESFVEVAASEGEHGAATEASPNELDDDPQPEIVGLFPDEPDQAAASPPAEPEIEESMAAIRELLSRGPRSRDELIREVATQYGYRRLGKNVAPLLDNHVRTAVRRGIAEVADGSIRLVAASLEEYQRPFLKEQFLAALAGVSQGFVPREETVRAFSRWMGYRRLGPVIQETARSLINGLIREDRIEVSGDEIRRART